MRKTREVLRLKIGEGRSNREVARACRISPSKVCDVHGRFKASGLTWPLPEDLDDRQLDLKLYPPPVKASERPPEPNWATVHAELRKKHVTLMLLWQEYKEGHPEGYAYSWFCEHYEAYRKTVDPVMRQRHVAGEKCFVDYAGDTVPIVDPRTGEVHQAQIFVGVLGASNYTFAEATWSQDLGSWLGSHVRMFEYFGGCPSVAVPDNLKSGITKPNFYDPDVNPEYQELASHYGITVLPARVRKPRDKAKAENGVLIVERWILAALRKRTFFSLEELNTAIRELLVRLNNRPFQKLPGSRATAFETIDRPALRPLPAQRYEFASRKKCRVHIDYHIELDGHYYSVPHTLVRQLVETRMTATTVEIFFEGRRIGSHPRSYIKGRHTTLSDHMPANHRRVAEWTPERMATWAGRVGNETRQLITAVLSSRVHPEQAFRACLGILSLGKQYTNDRLEAAARRANAIGCQNYRSMASILKHGLDKQPVASVAPRNGPLHENVRGRQYFGAKESPAC